MNRRVAVTPFDTNFNKVIITLCSQACEKNTHASRLAIAELLQLMHDNPQVMSHGNDIFDSATLFHDGLKWIVRMECLVSKN